MCVCVCLCVCVCVVWCGVQWDLSIASGNIRTPEHQKESINKSILLAKTLPILGVENCVYNVYKPGHQEASLTRSLCCHGARTV